MKNYIYLSAMLFSFLMIFSCAVKTKIPVGSSNLLVGVWQYEDVHDKVGIDEVGLKMLETFFGDMSFDFNPNKQYKAVMMGKKGQGTWSLVDNGKHLILTDDKGEIAKISILELSEKQLIIQFQEKSFVLKKN